MPAKKSKLTPEPRRLALGSLRYHLHEAGLPTHNATKTVLWTEINGEAIEIEKLSDGSIIIRRGKVTE